MPNVTSHSAYVEAPSRLHFGFTGLDENRNLHGSVGVALDNPLLRFSMSFEGGSCQGECAEELQKMVERIAKVGDSPVPPMINVHENIPRHVGLGSGTQMCLGAGKAALEIFGRPCNVEELAEVFQRGKRSKIGIASFLHGGFNMEADGKLTRAMFPPEWKFVIAIPNGQRKIYGEEEKQKLQDATRSAPEEFTSLFKDARQKILMGLEEKNIELFGSGVTSIDRLTGKAFSSVQGGTYTHPLVEKGLEKAFSMGAAGGGQSSWGPGFFAIVEDERTAMGVSLGLSEFLQSGEGDGSGDIFVSGVRNKGALIRLETSKS